MTQLLFYFFIGLSLSMDAFSLSLVYSMNNKKDKNIYYLSVLVGIFHLLMPLLGSAVGKFYLLKYIHHANIIVGIVFIFIAIQMIISVNKDTEHQYIHAKFIFFLIPFTVSLDSFSVGVALSLKNENVFTAGIVFAVISFIITFFGLKLGNKLNQSYGKKASIFGSIILLLLGIYHIVH